MANLWERICSRKFEKGASLLLASPSRTLASPPPLQTPATQAIAIGKSWSRLPKNFLFLSGCQQMHRTPRLEKNEVQLVFVAVHHSVKQDQKVSCLQWSLRTFLLLCRIIFIYIYLQYYFVDDLVPFQLSHKDEPFLNRKECYDHAISTFHALRNEWSKFVYSVNLL